VSGVEHRQVGDLRRSGPGQWRKRRLPADGHPRCVDCGAVIVTATALYRDAQWRHAESDPAGLFGACAWASRHWLRDDEDGEDD
jgi:hypothetical protein